MKRNPLYDTLLSSLVKASELIREYDDIPRHYGTYCLYQVEIHTLQAIGRYPGITITELAVMMDKTASALSQRISKLKKNGFVTCRRNANNKREVLLSLSSKGKEAYFFHEKYDEDADRVLYHYLDKYAENEIEAYIRIQTDFIAQFEKDVENSLKDYNESIKKQ